ncbi:MAG: hypothetical protein K0V04_03510 [Deltaproteobacteria bacterium]|nr:hypothetical protein [Deltaproteobacteria bacterium]
MRRHAAARRSTLALVGIVLAAGCDTAATDGAEGADAPWPSASLCADVEAWPDASASLEDALLRRIDAARSNGGDCGERGKPAPAPALLRRPALDCAARAHASDMVAQRYFGRLDPDGVDEYARVEQTEYEAALVVQHIARGPRDAEELLDQTWLPRPVQCSSVLSEDLEEVGLAYIDAPPGEDPDEDPGGPHWVVVLATPGQPPAPDATGS